MKEIYGVPLFAVTNVAGFLIESFFLIYLLARFFPARRSRPVSLGEMAAVAAGVTAVLLAGDLLSSEARSGQVYMSILYLLPLVYAAVRLEGGLLMKLLVSFLFMLMNSILESMFFLLQGLIQNEYALFFIRRILCKALLYFIVKFLLLGGAYAQVRGSRAYWFSLAVISVSEYLFMMPLLSSSGYSMPLKLLLILACIFIPLCFFYTIIRLIRVMDENQVYVSQNRQLELSRQYMAQVSELSDSLRRFRHDYKAHLFCIDALLSEEKYDQLHQYLLELHQSTDHCLSITQYTLNGPLDIVLNQKAEEARRRGIDLKIDVVCPEACRIRDLDLVTLTSNLLDNALEAAVHAQGPWAAVSIRREKAYLRIEVANATAGDVLRENPELFTTKPDRDAHGLGLKIVRNIVDHYEGMYQVSGDGSSLKTVVLLSAE